MATSAPPPDRRRNFHHLRGRYRCPPVAVVAASPVPASGVGRAPHAPRKDRRRQECGNDEAPDTPWNEWLPHRPRAGASPHRGKRPMADASLEGPALGAGWRGIVSFEGASPCGAEVLGAPSSGRPMGRCPRRPYLTGPRAGACREARLRAGLGRRRRLAGQNAHADARRAHGADPDAAGGGARVVPLGLGALGYGDRERRPRQPIHARTPFRRPKRTPEPSSNRRWPGGDDDRWAAALGGDDPSTR